MMELRQLSYFVAVAEELHFGRAAAKVNITQSGLSDAILALEKELGVQLLLRTTRRVELTRAGASFYERSVRMISELELSREIVRSIAGKTTRKIAIGTVYPATIGVLPSFLSRIGRKYPDIRMHIESGTTDDIIRHIEAGRINLGFIRPVENIGLLFCNSHKSIAKLFEASCARSTGPSSGGQFCGVVMPEGKAEREAMISPCRIGDDVTGKAKAFQARHLARDIHPARIAHADKSNNLAIPSGALNPHRCGTALLARFFSSRRILSIHLKP